MDNILKGNVWYFYIIPLPLKKHLFSPRQLVESEYLIISWCSAHWNLIKLHNVEHGTFHSMNIFCIHIDYITFCLF